MSTKICTNCGIKKDVSEFPKNKKSKDGLHSWCRKCHNEKTKEWQKKNLDKCRINNKKWADKNSDLKKEIGRKTWHKNKDKYNSHKKEWYYNNIDKVNDWHEKNHLKSLIDGCITRARNSNLPYDSKQDLYNYLKPIYDLAVCDCCKVVLEYKSNAGNGKKVCGGYDNSFSIDRIIPQNGYVIGNIKIICHRCNQIKNIGTPEEHRMVADWQEQNLINIGEYNNVTTYNSRYPISTNNNDN